MFTHSLSNPTLRVLRIMTKVIRVVTFVDFGDLSKETNMWRSGDRSVVIYKFRSTKSFV